MIKIKLILIKNCTSYLFGHTSFMFYKSSPSTLLTSSLSPTIQLPRASLKHTSDWLSGSLRLKLILQYIYIYIYIY